MKKKILLTAIIIFSVAVIFLAGLNISFYSYQKDRAAQNYGAEYTGAYSWTEEDFDEQYSFDYKNRMYVSKEDSNWLISDYMDGVSVNKYLGNDKNVVIPEVIDGKKVLRLDCNYMKQAGDSQSHDGQNPYDFYHCAFDNTDIKSITIPSGIKEIKCNTFSNIASSEKPTLEKVTVDKENKNFYSNEAGELCIRENDEVIYSYEIENTYYQRYSRFPNWMFFICNYFM